MLDAALTLRREIPMREADRFSGDDLADTRDFRQEPHLRTRAMALCQKAVVPDRRLAALSIKSAQGGVCCDDSCEVAFDNVY
jgi:hypothetical protein